MCVRYKIQKSTDQHPAHNIAAAVVAAKAAKAAHARHMPPVIVCLQCRTEQHETQHTVLTLQCRQHIIHHVNGRPTVAC
jgi:hypothetical protein